jgi:ribosomal protection tetracycline resistance protein
VQAQTRVLMRTLQRLRIPTLLFVNKIDRAGAQYDELLAAISARLTPAIIAMGSVLAAGSKKAEFSPYGAADTPFTGRLTELLADHDDDLLAAYVRDERGVPYRRLRRALRTQARRGLVHPVFFGSAMTGAGVAELTAGIAGLLPWAGGDPDGPVSGTVFKVERGPAGEKAAYVRMFSGTVRARERLRFSDAQEAKVTAISVFDRGPAVPGEAVCAGQLGKLGGLTEVRIGDTIGDAPAGMAPAGRYFAPPTLETVVVPRRRADGGALHVALAQLAEQDPLINLRQDDVRQELLVSLYGEVQKEVVQATLAGEYGIEVGFRGEVTICVERPAGCGAAAEPIATPSNPFLAGVGLRVEPAPAGSGVHYQVAGDRLGTMPLAFFRAVADTVHETLRQGLHGWQVTDCVITLTHTGYYPRQSHAHGHFDKSMSSAGADFRGLTPLVLMDALERAGTVVCEPVHRFTLEAPADVLATLLSVLAGLRAVPRSTATTGSSCVLDGDIPAARVHELAQQLPGLTRGEGVLDYSFDRYQPVSGQVPSRPRWDHNPLNRKEYLLHVLRGLGRQ